MENDKTLGSHASEQVRTGAHVSEQVRTGAHLFGDWLTIQEAVAHCLSKGLHRTPKTVRLWAQRSRDPESGVAEVNVKKQDTKNGFRWLIERSSLDVKIQQEMEYDLRNQADEADAHTSAPVGTGAHVSEQVRTGAHPSAPVPTDPRSDGEPEPSEDTPPQEAPPSSRRESGMVGFLEKQLEHAHHQLDVKDRQIEALLERDRETNILIQGLQQSLTGVVNALPSPPERVHDERPVHRDIRGDNTSGR